MLVITNAQLAAVQAARERDFAAKLIAALQADHPHRTAVWGQENLVDTVCLYLARARGYGISADRELRFFVSLQLLVVADWDMFPSIQRWLRSAVATGRGTLEPIVLRLSAEDWRTIHAWKQQRT